MASTRKDESQWLTSPINTKVYNYRVYYLTFGEKILYGLVALAVGGAVGYLFFGGLGRTTDGARTTVTNVVDTIVVLGTGIFAARYFLKVRAGQIRATKLKALERQFRDMLESLSTSLSAGSTIVRAFDDSRNDLAQQYSPDAPIVEELNTIVAGFHNNMRIEDMVADLAERSSSADIQSFANVFQTAYLKGADMKEAIRNTHLVLSEKMAMAEEIETGFVASKNESLIMVALPIVMVAILKSSGGSFSEALATPAGVVCTIVAVGLFVSAYALSRKIMTIEM
ncbi:type II secretion system F family protein [Sanguibacter sp. A247]|uniref:type II secretion system F family protein n=1 Tax=unclassified Sanguibacter TaxID=2645534 RepID=UPI003FD82765